MNSITFLNNIKKYLTRFQQLVKINTANNEYDINIHSENLLIPILNSVFEANFKNANNETKNADSVDLVDFDKKIAIQVTSTYKIAKVKSTLEKLLKSKIKDSVNEVFVYILTEKQSSYSQDSIDAVRGKFPFDVKKNIIDANDLYQKIKAQNNFDNIKSISRILEVEFSDVFISQNFSFQQLDEFKHVYKEKCITNFSRLNFFGLHISNKPREVELYSLFVNPTFRIDASQPRIEDKLVESINFKIKSSSFDFSKEIDKHIARINNVFTKTEFRKTLDIYELYSKYDILLERDNNINFQSLYSDVRHLIIIGNPGAGKSSMIKYSICKILEEDFTIFENKKIYNSLPIRIELHKYNQLKISKKYGLLKYLEILFADEYQIQISSDNLHYIFQYFPTLVFFDGLDEIFDVQERIEVRNDIENFVKSYHEAKIIVTSRFESYEEVSLNPEIFNKVIVNNFDNTQVEEYVNKWYQLEESNTRVREEEIRNCLLQLQGVDSELKHNPLLLSLILILYRNELEIPTSKLKIYEGCTHTIVDTRDTKEKKLKINLKVGSKISVFSSLAYWQFAKRGESQSFSYDDVYNHIKNFLIEKGEFDDEYEASVATREFLDFAKTRSIYLENKFTHKTFLEYFTAYYIYSKFYSRIGSDPTFIQIFTNYIGQSSWTVVLELLICKVDEQQIDYHVIDEIVEQQIQVNNIDAIIFFLHTIKYLKNISKGKLKFLFKESVIACCSIPNSRIDSKVNIFNQLVALYSIEKYQCLLDEVVENLVLNKIIKEKELAVFVYEFCIVSGKTSMLKLLEENTVNIDSEYLFVLSHYPLLHNEETYLSSIKKFSSNFSQASLSKVYHSAFNQKIFFGSNKFNWCITFIFRPDTPFIQNRNKLLQSGVTNNILIKSANKKSAIMTVKSSELQKHVAKSKDVKLKQFVSEIVKVNDPLASMWEHNPKEKFYDKFYQKYKRH